MNQMRFLLAVICLLSAFLGFEQASATNRVHQVCIGEHDWACPPGTSSEFGCNPDGSAPSPDDVSPRLCEIGTEKGAIEVPYEITALRIYPGNKCNYAAFTLTCLDDGTNLSPTR